MQKIWYFVTESNRSETHHTRSFVCFTFKRAASLPAAPPCEPPVPRRAKARLKYPWNSIVNFGQPYSRRSTPGYYASTSSRLRLRAPHWKYGATLRENRTGGVSRDAHPDFGTETGIFGLVSAGAAPKRALRAARGRTPRSTRFDT